MQVGQLILRRIAGGRRSFIFYNAIPCEADITIAVIGLRNSERVGYAALPRFG